MSPSAAQGDSVRSEGERLRLQAPLDKINLHLREGSIIPSQVTSQRSSLVENGGGVRVPVTIYDNMNKLSVNELHISG